MTQAPGALLTPTVLDCERTLILAIELSNTSWMLAARIPGLSGIKAKRSIEPAPEVPMAAIEGYRARAEKAGRNVERVEAVYETGWSGFWLVRWLAKHGVETHVIEPSSVPVDRRSRRAKSGRIDAELLLRTYWHGCAANTDPWASPLSGLVPSHRLKEWCRPPGAPPSRTWDHGRDSVPPEVRCPGKTRVDGSSTLADQFNRAAAPKPEERRNEVA